MREMGNVLFLILIAVALFAGLGYAVTSSLNTAPMKVEDEKQKLDQAVLNNCESAINLALLRLRNMGGCSDDEINYELPDGSNANPNAPADDHCNIFHPLYGGASPCGITTDPNCDLTALSAGESCSGIVYVGENDGIRIYTTRADHGGGISWNNGGADWIEVGLSGGATDGIANTNELIAASDIAAPYLAAQLCRSYGEEWYLPAMNELRFLCNNKDLIGSFPQVNYWSSTEFSYKSGREVNCDTNLYYPALKNTLYGVRCIRTD